MSTPLRRTKIAPSGRGPGRVTLARALSKLGTASRSRARVLIQDGHVRVNGRAVTDPDQWVDLRSDRLTVDDIAVRRVPTRWVMLHKPAGVVTTRSDERGRRTVFDLLGAEGAGLKTVGRLDLETSGLLLLTTDAKAADELTDPDSGIPKRYIAECDAPLSAEAIDRMRRGMEIRLPGGPYRTQPASVEVRGNATYAIILTEGKNRQVRRMVEAAGREVVRLRRDSLGGLTLGPLPEGEWRDLTPDEVVKLRSMVPSRTRTH